MTLQIQQELTMILCHILEQFNIRGRSRLGLLYALGKLQPLLQTPQIVVNLLPIALRAERTR